MTMLAAAVVILLLSHTALGHLLPSVIGIDKGNYSNTWAVTVADRIAERHGFVNKGLVSRERPDGRANCTSVKIFSI